MRRRGISTVLLMAVALVPLALVLDFALLFVSFPNALELVLLIDIPVFAVVGGGVFLSFRQRRPARARPKVSPSVASQKLILNAVNHRDSKPPRTNSKLPESEEEAEEAEVFLEPTNAEQSARDVDQIVARIKAKENEDLGVRPVPGLEPQMHKAQAFAEEPIEKMEKPSEEESKGYYLSPGKLKAPAFICRCGHTHRFLCLQCGTTVEMAAKKKNMHWVEWTPEMAEMP